MDSCLHQKSKIGEKYMARYSRKAFLWFLVLNLLFSGHAAPGKAALQSAGSATPNTQRELVLYIHNAWQSLTRSMSDCSSLADPKLKTQPVLYVPLDFQVPADDLRRIQACKITLQKLPKRIVHMGDLKPEDVPRHGLLFLPNAYVVPGGRFNEMYGWDSYFIIRGLIRDNKPEMARGMIENFFFEMDHYGSILNANRTYYFTRSQPPFLTSMIQAYYDFQETKLQADMKWLARAYSYAERDYELWTHPPHLASDTGLARYYDLGEGPVPEMGDDPLYYLEVTNHLLTSLQGNESGYVAVGQRNSPESKTTAQFASRVCVSKNGARPATESCSTPQTVALSDDFYKGDRAMRESGFDVSFRFGPFGGSTHHFAPVCLNSLLYKAETDMERFATLLGRPAETQKWHDRSVARKAAINKYLWNAQAGMFLDYDFVDNRQYDYHYASTFYPLWAGVATLEQAGAVAGNLKIFERPGGIAMSDKATGVQWDLPYGWAPLQLLAVEGLRRYQFQEDATRIATHFVETVSQNFHRDGTIREKYNVVTRSSETNITAGYKANVVGFGWTNGVVLVFLADNAVH
jgi:alpha,alpha-trehalase